MTLTLLPPAPAYDPAVIATLAREALSTRDAHRRDGLMRRLDDMGVVPRTSDARDVRDALVWAEAGCPGGEGA